MNPPPPPPPKKKETWIDRERRSARVCEREYMGENGRENRTGNKRRREGRMKEKYKYIKKDTKDRHGRTPT